MAKVKYHTNRPANLEKDKRRQIRLHLSELMRFVEPLIAVWGNCCEMVVIANGWEIERGRTR